VGVCVCVCVCVSLIIFLIFYRPVSIERKKAIRSSQTYCSFLQRMAHVRVTETADWSQPNTCIPHNHFTGHVLLQAVHFMYKHKTLLTGCHYTDRTVVTALFLYQWDKFQAIVTESSVMTL
jgi:hypothetical protein